MRRKWLMLLMAAALLTGCAPKAEPGPEKPPVEAPRELTPVTHPVVDWFDAFVPGEPATVAPLTDNACPTNGSDLGLKSHDTGWRVHPLTKAKRPFHVPSTEVVVCNMSPDVMKAPLLSISAFGATSLVTLPDLQPGQAAGPLRIYSVYGVPGQQPPFSAPNIVIRHELSPSVEPPAPTPGLPQQPTLTDLRQLARSQGEASLNGKRVELFLYAPNANYSVATDTYCGALAGAINVKADDWAIYSSTAGGAPVRAGEIGAHQFDGDRGMKVEPVPALGLTFLLFANYGSCANPNWYHVFAYDHATGKVVPVQMRKEDGTTGAATVTNYTFTPDGGLENRFYNNADGIGWHTYKYIWDKASFTWRFHEHIKG